VTARTIPAIAKSIEAARHQGSAAECEYRVEGHRGLILAVIKPGKSGSSTRTWRVCYSITRGGKRTLRRQRIGRYPAMSLREACSEAAAIMLAVERGTDPIADLEIERAEIALSQLTLTDLIEDYLADHRKQRHRTTADIERALKKDVVPLLGSRRPSEITPADIERVCDAVRDRVEAKRGGKVRGEMARRVLRYIKQVFNHALLDSVELKDKYNLTTNPAESVGRNRRGKVGRYGKAEPRNRVLSDAEIIEFLRVLETSNIDTNTRLLMKLLLTTGARLSEVRCLPIAELQLDGEEPVWVLPASRAKMRREHRKPLSPLAVSLLRAAIGTRRSGPVLPSDQSRDGFLTEKGARRAITRLFETGRLCCPHFTPHDLRRTVGTGLARLGVPIEIIRRVLAHKTADVTNTVYVHHDYEAEKRAAIERWSAHIDMLMGKALAATATGNRNCTCRRPTGGVVSDRP
jgi:integrase